MQLVTVLTTGPVNALQASFIVVFMRQQIAVLEPGPESLSLWRHFGTLAIQYEPAKESEALSRQPVLSPHVQLMVLLFGSAVQLDEASVTFRSPCAERTKPNNITSSANVT